MYCSKCGVQNPEGTTHCTNCGSVLMDAPQQAEVQGIPVMTVEPKTCGLAIASLVMGILSLFCSLFMAIPAIICGIIALVKISKSNGQLKGNGFAITGITVPAVVMLVIFPMMLAILMPALAKAKEGAMTVVCSANLKGLSTAMMVYMNDYDDRCPTSEQWCDLLIQEADVSPKSFQCPEDPEGSFSYSINKNVYEVEAGQVDAQMVVLFESNPGQNSVGGLEDAVFRHRGSGGRLCNIAFADGHTEHVTEDRIADLQWTTEP